MRTLLFRAARRLRRVALARLGHPAGDPPTEAPLPPAEPAAVEAADAPSAELIAVIEASDLFDPDYYLDINPDVAASGIDPLRHYLACGHLEGRWPSIRFNPAAYLEAHPDVSEAGMDPLTHYVLSGAAEGRHLEPPWWLRSRLTRSLQQEAIQGRAFLRRFGISARAGVPLGEGVAAAIDDLIARKPGLIRDPVEPDATIVIPVYGQLPFVLNCLDGLAAHESRFSAEIIVLDDASPTEMQTEQLGAIPWIRYIRRETNGGFIAACKHAASQARGRHIIFLNSDTRVAESWLDELIGSFALFPQAGLVGSKLLNEDLTLQEAGGIFWRDGSAWNYGRGDDPDNPKYSFARQVDYCSGAAIAVKAEAWREMEGFDPAFAPAYCEDADIAFRLRAAGYEVWLQPLACVLHYEGRTHGRDTATGVKAYQVTNLRRFAERWKSVLLTHAPNGVNPDAEANRLAKDRLLVIDASTPTPDRDAGSFVTTEMLRLLRGLGYQLVFLPQHNYLHIGRYTEALQRQGIECLYTPHVKRFADVLRCHGGFDTVLAFRYNVLSQVYDEIREEMPNVRILFHIADLHYLRQSREAALLGSRSGRIAAMMAKSTELELIAKVDCTIVHTPVEAGIIKEQVPVSNVIEIPWITELSPSSVGFEARHDIMFLGGFGHQPNVDAVQHFAAHIWPLLLPRLPEKARLVVVGAAPPPSILALENDRITITGYVEDLQDSFDAARIFVAPLRYGAGIKGKVIEALRRGTPSVISPIAAEGIGLTDGVETIVAESDEAFAERVAQLYGDREAWQRMQAAGYAFVEGRFSSARGQALLREALEMADNVWIERQEAALRRRIRSLCASEG